MTTYATVADVQAGMLRQMSAAEQAVCQNKLEEAAVIIDAYNINASADAKKVVSCRVVQRALGDGETTIPLGASQGSQSGLGYSESWTFGSGANGEIYLNKTEKKILGCGDKIGSKSPLEDLTEEANG